jgi:small subunit ribosomal protein S6
MALQDYETVFILTPVLSDVQMKDTVDKFRQVLIDKGAELVHEETWGLKKLAYPIQQKTTGFYGLFEFRAEPTLVDALEIEYRRDEKVLRFMTTKLDKWALEYNVKRRNGEFNKKEKSSEEPKTETAK